MNVFKLEFPQTYQIKLQESQYKNARYILESELILSIFPHVQLVLVE